ncbi:MAG TPA: translation elongation factor Ts [Halanaerobiales bacterium]|nr:translation elongation factor Ts [Halanaerobiales bacterium]
MGSMKKIKKLREKTGAGVLDCKKALSETDGNVEEAVDYLREKGISDAAKKSDRVAAEGLVNVMINDKRDKGLVVEINSETDFVAKNEKFKNLVSEMSNHIMDSDKKDIDSLLEEKWYDDDSKDVSTILKEAIASIGENINLRRFEKYKTDEFLHGYVHMNGKIGVLVEFAGEDTEENIKKANNVAMHIAAKAPEYISKEEVSDEVIEKEKKIYKEQMLNQGKPEHIIDNIVEGKINKYFTQICLVDQEYVRDTDITVGELLDEANLEVKRFERYELGEGIETEEEDFVSEVRAEVEKN